MSAQIDTRDARAVCLEAANGTGRLLAVCTLIVTAGAIGVLIAWSLRNLIASLPPAGLAAGAAAVLSVLKSLFESFPLAWDYITTGARAVLPKLFAQVGVAVMGLGFGYYAATATPAEPRALNLNVLGSLPPVVINEAESLFTAYVVFGDWKADLPVLDPQRDLIDNLVDSLAECIRDHDDKVQLMVRGFASSFGSDRVNDELYRRRTAYVAALIDARIKSRHAAKATQFIVDPNEWKSLKIMTVRRLFNDTDPTGAYLKTAGALNRRAEIRVRSAGSCAP